MTCADFIAWFLCILSKYTPAVRYYYLPCSDHFEGEDEIKRRPSKASQRGVLFESEKGVPSQFSAETVDKLASWLIFL